MKLDQLGWNPHFAGLFAEGSYTDSLPGRVAREDRGSYVVYGEGHAWRATVTGAFRHRAFVRQDYPAVGDWVAVQPRSGEEAAMIHAVLPRRGAVTRKAAGEGVEQQVIAANVDSLLICCGLDQDFNVRRIERYLTVAYNSGATPVIVLTKADLCETVDEHLAEVENVAIGVPILLVSIVDHRGIQELHDQVAAGQTAALVGSSGVGKSSLINALLYAEAMKTGAVRAQDGRGRHTTTHRQLLLLPGGGVIIDTPGMRELQLCGDEAGVDSTFNDIDAFAAQCRFRDCTHENEPDCAVRAAVERGELDSARMRSFRKQQAELRWLTNLDDPLARAEEKSKWKVIHKSARKWTERKYRY